MDMLTRVLQAASGRQDIVFASFFVVVVGMLVLPLPPALIDVLLAINMALSLTILLAATYLRSTLDLSTFPSILLVTTVFRLALTVSTTRMILAHGDAGHIIRGFGNFVVAGNVVVGMVVFLIVAIVQFIVITKGAERVAEVGARFTLDALPGKQLSIDSDFRNGEITKEEARRRRLTLEKESQFFGAMDGAMRFVKGDAIASLLVVAVNLFGGIAIGTLQKGLSLGEAAKLYSLLSIGDGLVAQIPSMFLAVAAGTVVTRVITEENGSLGVDIARQLVAEPRAVIITGVFVTALAAVPGFPTITFLIIGALMVGGAVFAQRARARALTALQAMPEAPTPASSHTLATVDAGVGPAPSDVQQTVRPLPVAGLAHAVTVRLGAAEADALERHGIAGALDASSAFLSGRLGFAVPPPGFLRDPAGSAGTGTVEVDGVPVARLDGAALGDPQQLAGMLADIQGRFAARQFGLPEAARWLDDARAELGVLVGDVQQSVPMLRMVEVLRRLLDEYVSLSQRRLILEALLHHAARESDPDAAADQIRLALRRQICHALSDADGTIRAIIAGPDVEDFFRGASAGKSPSTDQGAAATIVAQLRAMSAGAGRPVVITAGDVRRRLRQFMATHGIDLPVLSYAELVPEFQPRPLGTLSTRPTPAAQAAA
ncbi:MAG: FHIPEP family type III secretion protein [Alsobacter sp.]